MRLTIRLATPDDDEAIWRILAPMIHAGETYALPRDMARTEALAYWSAPGHEVFVALEGDEVVGTYFLQANQRGAGSHVANCGYVTAVHAAGRGISGALCAHSLDWARARGFRAMQFNFVVATNERAVALWQRFGFAIVGRLPDVFDHPRLGLVDALVMHRKL
jgi:GNAT superfamily N-acetyltransferase